MKKRRLSKLALLGFFGLSMFMLSCTNRNVLPSYYDHAPDHHLIGILPVVIENDLSEDVLSSITSEELQLITLKEMQNFQEISYRTILKRVGLRKHDIKISLQSLNVTNNRLREFGMDMNAIRNKDPLEIANILGVDAIVLLKVHKNILSDGYSGSIDPVIASKEDVFLEDEEEDIDDIENPLNVPEKYRVSLMAELIDGRDGSLLWHFTKGKNADIDYSIDKSVEDLNRAMTRRFPYKNFHKGLLDDAL